MLTLRTRPKHFKIQVDVTAPSRSTTKSNNSFSDLNECGVGGETHEEQHVHSIVQQIHAVIANLLYRAPGHKSGYEEPSDNQISDA